VTSRTTASVFAFLLALGSASAANAQPAGPAAEGDPPATTSAAPGSAQATTPADDPDLDVNLAQPDFALSALPTTLRLPKFKMVYRMTHRFYEPVSDAGLGGVFGMDSGAMVGLELRVGLWTGWQAAFYRTSDKTIQFSMQYDVVKQGRSPLGIAAFASAEGTNNFKDSYSPAVGAVFSREAGTRAAIYVEPVWVNNSNPEPKALVDDNSTWLLGVGARLRVLDTTYLVAEIIPRVSGYGPGTTQASFGLEKRAGGHLFQLTFANSVGTTWGHIARGGPEGNHWVMGFNLVRKFY
jgi:hypothetical protein